MATRSRFLWTDRAVVLPLIIAAASTVSLSAGVLWRATQEEALHAATERRDALMGLADELRYSSDALTHWARAYAVTGTPLYRSLHTELIETRRGIRPQPPVYAPIYWNLREFAGGDRNESRPAAAFTTRLSDAGADPAEMALLESALAASERLSEIERRVMDQRDESGQPEITALVRALLDTRYMEQKSRIIQPIEQFALRVEKRTHSETERLESAILLADRLIGTALLLMMSGIGLAWFGFRRLAGDSFAQLVARIRALVPEDASTQARGNGKSIAQLLGAVAGDLSAKEDRIDALMADTQRERDRLRLFVEHAPIALALFDREMRYLACSTRWITTYRLQGQPLLGHSVYEISPDTPDTWRENYRRGLSGEILQNPEDRVDYPDGSTQYLRWEMVPWRDADGSVAGVITMSEDITETVTQRKQLRAWTRAYEQAHVGAAITDPTQPDAARIVDVNPQLARLLGYAREELCGKEVNQLIPEELRAPMRASIPELDASGHIGLETQLLSKSGRRIPVLLDITNEPEDPGEARRRTVFVIELSERKRLMEDLERMVAELKATNEHLREARDEAIAASSVRHAILSNISHELRTPLNHVLGFAALLDHPGLDQKTRERVRHISAAGTSLSRLVTTLLDAVRLETDALRIDARDFDLPRMLRELESDTAIVRKTRGIRFVCTLAPDLPTRIHGDPRRLAQALHELLDNAAKFSMDGKAIELCARRQTTASGADRLLFEVTDHGAGIAPGQQDTLFDWFRQGDPSTTRRSGGIGMGLVIAQRIVALLGGEIGYRATKGGGSTFWFAVPLEAAHTREATSDSSVPDPEGARAWLLTWLAQLQAANIEAGRAWEARPASVDSLLGDRQPLVGTAVANFDFDIAAELVADALGTL